MQRRLVALSLLSFIQPGHAGIDIVFDYSADANGFFSNQVRRNTLESAAAAFEARIADSLSAITPGSGSNVYTLSALNPSGGGLITLVNQPIAANEVRIYVGAQDLGSLGFSSTQFSVNGTQSFVNMVASRGQSGALATPPTDYGPWGGSITFDASVNWQSDATALVATSQYDLYSVAVHEIGHLLGIGQSGAWNAQSTTLQFNGAAASSVLGGPVPLADNSHWASSVRSPINGSGSFETALDPELQNGTRKTMTDLDWAALQDVGWQVSPIPEPQMWMTMLAGLCLLAGARWGRRVARDSRYA